MGHIWATMEGSRDRSGLLGCGRENTNVFMGMVFNVNKAIRHLRVSILYYFWSGLNQWFYQIYFFKCFQKECYIMRLINNLHAPIQKITRLRYVHT